MAEESSDKKKPARVRLVGDVISAFRPEVRRGNERVAAWISKRLPEGDPWGKRVRAPVAERVFSILTNEIEEWAKKKGGVVGELTETLVTDSADLFDASFWRKQKEAGIDLVSTKKVKEINLFWTEARKKIFEAEDPRAEGERQFQRWEVLKSVLDRAGQAEEEAKTAAEPPQPEEPAEERKPIKWGKEIDHVVEVATRPLDRWSDRLEQRAQRKGRKI